MKNRILALLVVMLALTEGVFADGKKGSGKTEIIVAAGASLTEAINELIPLYCAKEGNVKIIATYGSSGSFQKQIEQGAPVDLFISASPKQILALDKEGLLVAGSTQNLLYNSLLLITPRDRTGITSFADAGTGKIRQIAIGEPSSVPAGQYAAQIFDSLGILDEVKAKSVYAKDVRQVLAYVESGEVDAGVVYATDAALSKSIRIAAKAPNGSHDPVVYPAAIVKASVNQEATAKFLKWLAGPDARAVFSRYGFALP